MASEPISTAEAPAAFQTHHALGNLIRLYPLTLGEVPNHPQFANVPQTPKAMQESSTHPEIVPFLRAVLAEASTFIDTTVPSTFVKKQLKASKPAVAKVQLLQRTITPEELAQVPWTTSKLPRHVDPAKAAAKMEPWFARRSRHSNQSEDGTADYPEFDAGLRVEHSVKERMYTPNVFDSYKVLDWDADTKGLDIGDGWRDVDMSIYEMCHKLPSPLSPRVFPVLIITAKTDRHEFIVVQIPIDASALMAAYYSNGRNIVVGKTALKRKKPVLAVYTSVERCRMLPDLNIEWSMAMASDAKGWIPMWMQKLGVPGAIVKDVGLFIKWVAEHRKP